ncbi:hypothetical protein FNY88_10905 [Corynebacterium guaraldiae]|uniref:Phage transcriptional regulator, ArpU family n=1 Tax=Corynebacterium guaraldiae TaxID=3051103 RepID=A0ABY3CRQ2_9CORY|nr:hypothetical protein [Corynebacterium guaraldiae]TRX47085.1 hypothetical protein FNY88_10905 [Corynebacterium guaraldiae]TRX53616.1 hypothetical protein FNY91_04075 [Corynebacterium guaraldiae]
MHVMTKYLDTRKAAIAALCDFALMEHAADHTHHVADELRTGLASPASPRLDGTPPGRDSHSGEARLAATLDKIDLIAERQREARQYMDWFLPAWEVLSEDDRFILETFFLGDGSQEERVQVIADRYYIEKDSVYRRKNRALDRFAIALYGRF